MPASGNLPTLRADFPRAVIMNLLMWRALTQVLSTVALALLASGLSVPAQAQTSPAAAGNVPWPARPVRLIVPFLPGGTVDALARELAQRLTEQTGQTVLVENRPGGNGAIGSEFVAKATPDGHTLLVSAPTFVLNPVVMRGASYDPARDFTAVTLLGTVPMLVVAHPSLPAANLAALIGLARNEPDRYSLGVASIGSPGHLATEALRHGTGLRLALVTYKGTAGALNDLLGGHLSASIDSVQAFQSAVKAGRLKVLAVTTPRRLPAYPDVPTVAESGLPGFSMVSWYGLWAPAGLPAPVLGALVGQTTRALRSPEMSARLAEQGVEPSGASPEAFERWIAQEVNRTRTLVREAGLSFEAN
jgi:tripartite-type tricarboxylate transporter receptor subunit TctC